MAYEKFALNITFIDQIVANQSTPFPVAATLAHFCASNISLLQSCRFYKFNFTIPFFLLILKTCLLKKNCLYI